MRDKIVFMVGGTETLDYFSRQLEKGVALLGYKTFLLDQTNLEDNILALHDFCGYKDTILITFNFDGINYEPALYDRQGVLFWEKREIPCVNIAVDHPFYYPKYLSIHPKNYYHISIDRNHEKYMKTYYPEINSSYFLPLGGTSLFPKGDYLPIAKRKYSVVFAGNYTQEQTFDRYINRLGKEYADFYRQIIDDLLSNPSRPDDLVMEKHLLQEFPHATKEELKETMSNMIFIDLYIRNYFRGDIIKTLIRHHIPVHCIGNGWDTLSGPSPYFSYESNQNSLTCLERISQAKICLNIMPWFKDGAHDRIFNAMANGAVCVTDDSIYLNEILSPQKNAVFYSLKEREELSCILSNLLSHPDTMQDYSDKGYEFTMKSHTWIERARQLHHMLLKNL